MGRRLDAKVAEAMGWRLVPGQAPRFSENMTAAYTMEDWIEEHADPIRYVKALSSIIERDWDQTDAMSWGDFLICINWRLAHATPEQRCRAFLTVMEEQ